MGLVDDDRVVGGEEPVPLDLVEQDPVGHDFDQRLLADPVGEADGVAHRPPHLAAEFLGHPFGHRPGRQPAGLGVADHAPNPLADLEADLGQLRALPRAGLAGHDHDLVGGDGGGDLVLALADGERGGVAGGGDAGPPVGHLLLRRLHLGRDLVEERPLGGAVLHPPGPVELAPEAVLIPGHERGQAGGEGGMRRGHGTSLFVGYGAGMGRGLSISAVVLALGGLARAAVAGGTGRVQDELHLHVGHRPPARALRGPVGREPSPPGARPAR